MAVVRPLGDLAGGFVSLIWAVAILAFGVLLMVCVLLLLKRESERTEGWNGSTTGQHLRYLSRLLRAIRAINSLIVTERDGAMLVEKACSLLTVTRGYRMAWIGFIEDGSKRVRPASQAGFEEGYLDRIVVTWDDSPNGRGPTGQAIKTGEPITMRDIETAPEYRPWREEALKRGYRSSAALPLRFKGQVLGALSVYAEQPDAFDIEEVGLLQEVADHLAYALGSIRLEGQLVAARQQVRQAGRFRDALRSAPVGIMVTDASGLITDINPHMLELLNGYERPEEVVDRISARNLAIFRGPEAEICLERVLVRREPAAFDLSLPGPEAVPRSLHCSAVPVLADDGELDETIWLVGEVPERVE